MGLEEEGLAMWAYIIQDSHCCGGSQCSGEGHRLCSWMAWFRILALPYISSVTLGKLLTPSEPQFPHL